MITPHEYWDKIGSRQLVKDENGNHRAPTLEERTAQAFIYGASLAFDVAGRLFTQAVRDSNIPCPLCGGRGLIPDECNATSGDLEICPCQKALDK